MAPDDIRLSLSRHRYAGLALGKSTVADIYATVDSTPDSSDPALLSGEPDWAAVSYVNTESAIASGGMPQWIAADVDSVLEDLYRHRLVSRRAIWFDRLAARQLPSRWPVLATLHALAVPLICVPPTRTIEYSRYQIPPQWSSETTDYFTRLELILRQCGRCVHRCPLEYDTRLLNLAATLRAWPVTDAVIAANARGAFISFVTLDRLRYTLSWYQVLLQLVMRIYTRRGEPEDSGDDLYGPALFQPCQRCVAHSSRFSQDEPLAIHIDALEDSLATLVAHAQRFCLPSGRPSEVQDLWALRSGLRAPGERALSIPENDARVEHLVSNIISQPQFEEIAAGIVSGRSSMAPCYSHADKWLCALILSNIGAVLTAFESPPGSFPTVCRSVLLTLIRSEYPFGRLHPKDIVPVQDNDESINKCTRSPPCPGTPGNVCLFNEYSGTLPPSSVGQFFAAWGVKGPRLRRMLSISESMLCKRMHDGAIAFECFEFEVADLSKFNKNQCVHCRREYGNTEQYFLPLLLMAWNMKARLSEGVDLIFDEHQHATAYTFITVDVKDTRQSHVWSRGTFDRNDSTECDSCHASFTRAKVLETGDSLEIHTSAAVPITTALCTILEAIHASHEF